MLRKLKVVAIVGLALQVARSFGLELDAPDDFPQQVEALVNSLYVVVPVVVAWFTPENESLVARLKMR